MGLQGDADLEQQSPTFLAPGVSFLEDNFSTGQARGGGRRRVQTRSRACIVLFTCYSPPKCAAWFLKGHRVDSGVGTSDLEDNHQYREGTIWAS